MSAERITTGKSFGSGDIIGCQVRLEVFEYGNQLFHHCQFFTNGEKSGYPVILEGTHPLSIVSLESIKSKNEIDNYVVAVNMGKHSFVHNIGKYLGND